jgi:SHS2 domain-containing protein
MAAPDRGYETLEHTADVGLRAWGPDLAAVFEQAAMALIAIMGQASGPATRHEDVTLEAPDGVALLVEWLSEVVFLFEARTFVPLRIDADVEAEPWRVRAAIDGCDAESFEQNGPAVKAVTYHEAELARSSSGYEARVYLDV